MFKNFVSETLQYANVEKIFPTKQKDVAVIVDYLRQNDLAKKVIIFGSAVTWACNPWSDIDIYIEFKDKSNVKLPYSKIKSALDIWDDESADENLINEINNTGVVVYEN